MDFERHIVPVLLALAGVLAVTLAADCGSPVPALALFSRPERSEGFWFLAHWGLFIALVAALIDDENKRRSLFGAYVIGSGCVSLIGIASYATYALAGNGFKQEFSTLGNPVWLGQYAGLCACLCLFMWERAKRRQVYEVVGALNILMVFLCQGRGAAIAMVSAVLFVGWRTLSRRGAFVSGGAVALVLIGIPTMTLIPRVRRFDHIGFSDPRFAIWRVALKAIWDRPWLGWGQDGFLLAGGAQFPADRAHNLFLDWLIVGGVAGLVAWSALFAVVIWAIHRAFRGIERTALYAFLLVYFATNMTLFDTISTYALLGAVIGAVAASKPIYGGVKSKIWYYDPRFSHR